MGNDVTLYGESNVVLHYVSWRTIVDGERFVFLRVHRAEKRWSVENTQDQTIFYYTSFDEAKRDYLRELEEIVDACSY